MVDGRNVACQAMTKDRIGAKLAGLLCVLQLAVVGGCDLFKKGDEAGGEAGAKPSAKAEAGAADAPADGKDEGGEGAKGPALPDAEGLLSKAVEAAGGAAKFAEFKSFYYKGQLVVAGQKLEANAELWWKEGNFYTQQDMTGVGLVKAGKDGEMIWSQDPINGLRTLDGLEAEQVSWMSSLMLAADWKRYFSKAETVKEMLEDDTKLYVVKLTSDSGAEVNIHLDAESGLQKGMAYTQATPMGEIPITLKMEGYREFEGMQLAFKQVTDMPLASATLEIVDLKLNPEISDARFQMPRADADVVKKPDAPKK